MTSQIIKSFISDRILVGVTLLYISLCGTLFVLGQGSQLLKIILQLESALPQRMASILFLTSIFLLSCLVRVGYKNRVTLNNYTFNETTGLFSFNKNGQLVCTSCLVDQKRHSPVKHQKYGWQCQVKECGKQYMNPDNPPPKSKRKIISKGINRSGSWINNY